MIRYPLELNEDALTILDIDGCACDMITILLWRKFRAETNQEKKNVLFAMFKDWKWYKKYNPTEWGIFFNADHFEADKFWKEYNEDAEFYDEMNPIPEIKALVQKVHDKGNLFILSKQFENTASWCSKQRFIQKHFPNANYDIISSVEWSKARYIEKKSLNYINGSGLHFKSGNPLADFDIVIDDSAKEMQEIMAVYENKNKLFIMPTYGHNIDFEYNKNENLQRIEMRRK